MATQTRSPEQIKADLERHRTELASSIERLQGEVAKATDWRSAVARNQQKVLIGVAVAGFVIGGGIAGVTGIFRRR